MKILLIRFSSIGDIVLTSPVIRCLKKQMPSGTEIHYLTKPGYATLLDQNPYIDKLWLLKPELGDTIREIKDEGFDKIIDLHNNLRTLTIKMACDVPNLSFDKINWQKFLLTKLRINLLPKIHIVDRYFKAIALLGVVNDGQGLDYFTPSTGEELYRQFPEIPRGNFISMAVGGQHATKRMPANKLSEIIQFAPLPVILLGGKEDEEAAHSLAQKHPDKVVDLAGRLSLHQSAGVIALSKTLITHDTGMMHIAAALKKPVLAIWGNTIPQFGMYPYYGDQPVPYRNFEVEGLKCRPCSKLGFERCPKGHFKCMQLQDTRAIAEAIQSE